MRAAVLSRGGGPEVGICHRANHILIGNDLLAVDAEAFRLIEEIRSRCGNLPTETLQRDKTEFFTHAEKLWLNKEK